MTHLFPFIHIDAPSEGEAWKRLKVRLENGPPFDSCYDEHDFDDKKHRFYEKTSWFKRKKYSLELEFVRNQNGGYELVVC